MNRRSFLTALALLPITKKIQIEKAPLLEEPILNVGLPLTATEILHRECFRFNCEREFLNYDAYDTLWNSYTKALLERNLLTDPQQR